ncbi:MAG: hypothetical protein COX38_02840 [Candidatus Nealsonbacteria bacterium CG23_combo_of_CG06-09_8_20_14_all_39_25]|uniref:Uncharacterized protein n=3 Tax=Candidatus Nealsoniibacteriota TaxID=1817911 RepID=A0A2G9YS14_9BACT|nr:MAG: hypothetical protein COX38_02840 [Candidatus Nealsonbacteria bacterium CG23_combo_of_CG06-09_8_20_14_all_39_25]PIQ98527.1 MAG: hypothetical protein COV64_00730 [Candidatus Nealsonbacteria bacterium CG11_big_fil_rev_8_21_14_0_20_39_9]PIZ88348.1 MAG: hypothetical protein COX91_00655 [Candidatus Nealsonbacteria bacterium CG_4_10_14_0_2_um_filter_39_15]
MWNNKLEKIKVRLTDLNGFYSRISSDGIIYIPQDIVKNQKLRQNDVVLIRVIKNNKVIKEKYTKIAVHRKRNKLEYVCVFDKNFYGKELIFQIKKEASEEKVSRINLIIRKILKNFYFTFVNKNLVIVFKGNKVPAVINTNLKYSDVVFYLGAYFADGTRKGNSWAICASTFEQARYYLKMHNFLIKDSRPEFAISYTNIYNIEPVELKKNLVEIWQKEVSIKVNKFRIRKPSGKSISKWNKYGTLVIREHRQILLDFYNALLESLVKEISLKKDKKLAIDFVCGVMEGDGCAPAKKRGHITIATNKEDLDILKNIVKVAQINFKVIQQSNKYTLRIGALEILRNFYLLKDKIFLFYPKRRKALFERLKTVGAIKFLIGNHGSTNWVKAWLKNNSFVDKNYEITKNGLNLSNNLLNEMAKLRV